MLGQDRDRQQRQHGVRPAKLQHHGRVVGRRDGLHGGQVGAPVAGLRSAVEDPVVGVGDVARGQRLAVGPLDAFADVEGPGQAVLGRLPRRREGRRRRHVLHRVADHVVVHQRPHLVRRGLVAVERVERVDLVEERDGEGHRLVVGGIRRLRSRAPRRWPAPRPSSGPTSPPASGGRGYGAPCDHPAAGAARTARAHRARRGARRPLPLDAPDRRPRRCSLTSRPSDSGTTLPPDI